ncbi:Male sterility protein [Amycolatopsis arida]|uniref:Male sterility protein n=1 Tax=Amycolatopsis arida TaxID=587909 RepID=A0A1I5V6U7_9PSEU|nr:SDR family oxidoreductase [Amycolatopsis arida]TDX91168.1 male sterility protein [Amycolatopsis arida]SFQ03067.1 Male sterility protein [Amycolatopsis arida]
MRLLLTGITGQLGTAVAGAAPERGVELVPLVRGSRPGRVPFERAFPALAGAAVRGDVRAPGWGLPDPVLDELSRSVDAVVDLAGETNWAGSGRDLYTTNVLGARHGLDVARELRRRSGRHVAYCYASSIFVAGGALGHVAEAPLPPDRHRTAYEHSKWVAERELVAQHRPGDPDVLISRVGALLGDARTGETRHRNSLYLLAERWDDLPGRVLPVMRGARVDVLPRDVAAAALLDSLAGLLRAGPRPQPVITHLCAGERAPTLRALLEAARAAAPLSFGSWVRLVPAGAEQVLWLSANAERFLPLPPAWRNSLIGLRYIGLDRVMDRGRLADLVDGPLPAPDTELLARLLFALPAARRPVAPADAGLSRFQP